MLWPMTAAKPKVVLLCGGQGTRMREETEFRPKPMVEIGGRPLLWHIMKLYATHGFDDFVLCLGYRGEMIKEYFLDYRLLGSDFTVDLATGRVDVRRPTAAEDWRVTLVDTGVDAMTGARVKRVEPLPGRRDLFLCTYGDGLADIDIAALVAFHRSHGRLGHGHRRAPAGALRPAGARRRPRCGDFAEKPHRAATAGSTAASSSSTRPFLDRLSPDAGLHPRARAARGARRATASWRCYAHDGYWQCADTVRDVELLRGLWEQGGAPWRVWDDRSGAAPIPGDRRGAVHAVPEAALAPKDA